MSLFDLDNYTFMQVFGSQVLLEIGMVIVIIFSFFICKKHGISKLSTLLFILCGYSGGIYCAKLMGSLYTKVSHMHGGTGGSNVAIFGVIVGLPIVLIALSYLLGKDWRTITDLFAPGAMLGLAFAKFGCYFSGCCPGIECKFGIYNHIFEKVMFPSQIFESITMVFVVAFSLWYSLRYKKRVHGAAYPITAMVYVSTRFFWEFFRYYDPIKMKHLFLGLSFWQLWCIVVFVTSVIWLRVLKIPKLQEIQEKYNSFAGSHLDAAKEKIKSKISKKSETVEDTVSE